MSKFADELATADRDGDLQLKVATRLHTIMTEQRITPSAMLRALLGNVAAIIKASALGPDDWAIGAQHCADELRLQLQVPSRRVLDMRN